MNFNELFIDKSRTLIVNTDLAMVLGDLNEAIALNQLNYWIEINRKAGKHFIDGKYWVYNSYSDWRANNFPYWSEKTIQRIFSRLESKGVVISANFNKAGFDKTKWYSIDEVKLQKLVDEFSRLDNLSLSCGQNDRPIPENTNTENTSYAFTESYDSIKGTLCSLTSVSEDAREEEKRYPIEDVPYLIKKYADKNIRETRLKNLSDIIVYFIDVYAKNSNTEHMSVSETAIKNIIDAYINATGKVKDADVWEYEEIINDYFKTNYKMDGRPIVKSLQHFFSGKIRENIYMKRI